MTTTRSAICRNENRLARDADRLSISVVIPARNAGRYLADTLKSVEKQSCEIAEVVVVDDGSQDETGAIARQHGARLIRTEGIGAAAALNRGIGEACGDLIAHFDADDIMLAEKLRLQRQLFEADRNGRLGLVSSDLRMFAEGETEPRPSFLEQRPCFLEMAADESRRGTAVEQPAPRASVMLDPSRSAWLLAREHCIDVKGLYRRAVWAAVGGFDPRFRCAYDMDFVWRVSRICDVAIVPQVLFLGRSHAAGLSRDPALVARECARLFRRMRRQCRSSERRALQQRLRNELFELAWQARHERRWGACLKWLAQGAIA